MPINRGDIPFIGIHDGLCGYISHGRNIVRVASRLTGARVKVDPAFKGFRASGNRMKLGVDKVVITKKLQELYIDPMLQQPVKRQHYFPDISDYRDIFI